MWSLGPVGFTAPLLLLGLILLPILWLLLRAVPPAPIRRRFPGVALLLGLTDDETQTDRTPWWLLLIRMMAIAAAIVGFSGPVLNPEPAAEGDGPLLVLLDGTWAQAPEWERHIARADAALADASEAGRAVAVVLLTDLPPDGVIPFRAPQSWRADLAGLSPRAWAPDPDAGATWAGALSGGFDTIWMSDGLAREGRAGILSALNAQGRVTVIQSGLPVFGLRAAQLEEGIVVVDVVRSANGGPAEITLEAHGLDPGGTPRVLAEGRAIFGAGDAEASVELSLPPELRNRIIRFELPAVRSAGTVRLADDGLRRREVALISARDDREGLELLSPVHYLEQALAPTADLISGDIADLVLANPDVIVLADIATLAGGEEEALIGWVEAGGILVRFAGPRLAASNTGRGEAEPLMPVRLRAGGRNVGGAMSWGEPKALRAFGPDSPFFGLELPGDVSVSAQVMAEPDPDLAARTIATLTDGTPLVTRKRLEAGQVVLFHVTANAEWSTLPLSGLFVQMLERLAISSAPGEVTAEDLAGTVWVADEVLSADGRIQDAGALPGVPGEAFADAPLGPGIPPGLYAGEDRRLARNVLAADDTLTPAVWPAGVAVEGLEVQPETPLKGLVLALAMLTLMVDIVASLFLSGRLGGLARGAAAILAIVLIVGSPGDVSAQSADDLEAELRAASEVTLAYVETGDVQLDRVSEAGLRGLSRALYRRTSVEPSEPTAVNLETDELSVFPFIYWPVTPDQPRPSSAAYAKLNRYLRTGGMILFDTRDSDTARFGASSPNGRKLREIALPLDVPPLEPIPADHVLTRTFYLLQDFPGRHAGRDVWVEAAPPDAELAEGMPFRNLNDNVTPVIIGGNDWAAAWATDVNGAPMFPVGRGFSGERQREIAYRFGVNLIMHVLTGNYKSDQVHVPALLDRLGQ